MPGELADLPLQRLIDLPYGLGKFRGLRAEQFLYPGQRHARVSQRLDTDQVDDGLRVVAPVPRGVPAGLASSPRRW